MNIVSNFIKGNFMKSGNFGLLENLGSCDDLISKFRLKRKEICFVFL